jgi:TonB-linked SusC/RagA family outer membrane protein
VKEGFGQGSGGSFANPIVGAISGSLPFYPFYNEDGSYANTPSTGPQAYDNPLANYDKLAGNINETTNQTISLAPYLQVDFGRGIYAKTTLGVNIIDQRQYEYWSALYNTNGYDYKGMGQAFNWHSTYTTWNNILGWNHSFNGKHDVSLLLGQEMQIKNRWFDYYAKSNFPFAASGLRDLTTAGTVQGIEYGKSEARLESFFTDARYSYDNRYYLSASFRRDGSSVFGKDRRWGNFWSLGAKWRLVGENFLKNNRILTNAALRVSYGTVGNQEIGWYSAQGFYSSGSDYNELPGMVPTSITNPKLTWEVSNKLDIGVDLSLFNRVSLTFDYYNDLTTSALFEVPLSRTTGMTSTMQNIGEIRNSGVEFSIEADIIQNKQLTWSAYANMTYNRNCVVKLFTAAPIENEFDIIEVGRPYRQYFMREYAGVDRETGKPLWYKNKNGDETTTNYAEAEKRYLGSADPKLLGGFGTALTWKGIDFNLSFNYRLGGKVYDRSARFVGFGMALRTPLEDVANNSWTPENKDAKYPQWILNDPNNATQGSSRFLYSSNFLRISNIRLGYTFPEQWTKKALIEKLRLYISVDNLYTFTAKDFVGYTPETFTSGVIAWQYPTPLTFIGGIQITF